MSVEKTEIETFFGRCRCCLSYGYLKNMWVEHQFGDEGEAEIYGEMLVQCFALTWDHSEDSMEQDQICEQCISRLRDANDFKRVVLDSQAELFQQIDAENELNIKEERLDEEFLIEYKRPDSEDTGDTMYTDTEYTMDTTDTVTSVKEEMEYEEVEYLEEEDAGGANDPADTDSSQPTDQFRPAKRRKQPRKQDTDDEDGPKRKWPKKLPKSERQKTYKQYSEMDLRKCLEEVRNNVMTASEAALKYDIPKKTICAKIKMDPNAVRTDIQNSINNTTTRETVTTSQIDVPILSHEEAKLTGSDTESQEVPNKYQLSHKDTESDAESEEVPIKYPILDEEAKKTNSDTESQGEVPNKIQMLKHKNNLKIILKYSNATLIKGNSASGYSCWFCDKHFSPEKLKKHNFQHGDVYDDAIKVKYVSDLIIKLDVTGLKCRLCEEEIDSLEQLMAHFQENHNKTIYTDIDNHLIPFKFDTNELQCVICAAEFKYFKLLSEHMCEHYSNYNCPECDRVFINKQSMQTHRYRHKKGEYKCSQCPKIFDSPMKIREHEYVTHKLSNKKRKCGFCDEKFSSADLVKNHEAKSHGVARSRLTCEACKRPFATQKSLAVHKKRHHLVMRPLECEICGKGFYTRQELNWHSVTHTKTKEFHCPDCDNSFGTKPALTQHLRAHRGIRRYMCEHCDVGFVHMSTWQRHVFYLHREKAGSTRKGSNVQIDNTTKSNNIKRLRKRPAPETKKDRKSSEANLNIQERIDNIKEPCNPDDQRFMYKHKANIKAILQHSNATLIKTYGRDGYSCNFCNFQGEKPFVLKQHNLKKHTEVGDEAIKTKYVSDLILKLDTTDFQCKLCKEPMNTLEEFMRHLSKIHSRLIYTDVKNYIIPFKFDSDDFRCFLCDKNFKYFKLLSEHMTEHYRNFDCPDCDRSFINKQSLQTHTYRHFRGIFKCSYCSKEFDSRPKRADHERAVHMGGKNRKCAYCDRRFPTLNAVMNHELNAHGVAKPKHTCEVCGKTYSKQSVLTIHKNRCHLFKKPHKCSSCEMAFCTKVELNFHIITHTKTRNHCCEICNKSFGTQITLSQHIRTHEGVKKLLCDYCDRPFLNRTTYKRHMRENHGEIV